MAPATIPYCGSAPVPGFATWNFDPLLIGGLAILVTCHFWLMRPQQGWRRNAALAGWAILAMALISPLCNLSVALFSARVSQHMLIATIAAPLIALAFRPRPVRPMEIAIAALSFAGALWLWHSPTAYQLTFDSTLAYWTMHVSMFAAALWLSVALFSEDSNLGAAILASFFTTLQMSLLGALLAFSPRPLFAAHLFSTAPWGYSPLEDQQLGGLIMWIPAGVLLVIYAVVAFGRGLARLHQANAGGHGAASHIA
jgi:putative membrane protein